MEKVVKSRRYTPAERKKALARAEKVGPKAAGLELGMPEGTICNWRYYAKQKLQKAGDRPVETLAMGCPRVPSLPYLKSCAGAWHPEFTHGNEQHPGAVKLWTNEYTKQYNS
jgi:hypothetical protein